MSDIATVRRRIGDRTKAQRDIATGNGIDRSFHLQYENVFSVIVMVADQEMAVDVDYALDGAAGRVIFVNPPADKARVQFDYNYAAYTDDEMLELLNETGSVNGATIAALEELTADSARLFDFTQGETTNKRSQVFDHLVKLLERYQKAEADSGGSTGTGGKGLLIRRRIAGPTRTTPPYYGGTQDLTRNP
jgi:hypothetical protein